MPTYQQYGYGPSYAEAWYWQPQGGAQIPLQSPYGAWNVSTIGGSRFALPAFRGTNYETPYRGGQAWRSKMPDSKTLSLAMWVDGQGQQLPTSAYPAANPLLAWNNNLQQLRASLFMMGASGSVQGSLTRNWYLTQAGVNGLVQAVASAEMGGSVDLTMNGRLSAAFSVDFLLADPFFYGAASTTAVTTGGVAVTNLGDGVAGIGYPAANSSFTVTCTAACTVTNATAGVSFTLATGPTYPVTVDILNGTAIDAGGNNQIAAITHAGARAWMVLLPGSNACATTAGTATFVYNPPYL
jgi:hypothetical protein